MQAVAISSLIRRYTSAGVSGHGGASAWYTVEHHGIFASVCMTHSMTHSAGY